MLGFGRFKLMAAGILPADTPAWEAELYSALSFPSASTYPESLAPKCVPKPELRNEGG